MSSKPTKHNKRIEEELARFKHLPDDAFVRAPVVQALFGGISSAQLWRMAKDGRLPAPVKLSDNITGFRVGGLRERLRASEAQS